MSLFADLSEEQALVVRTPPGPLLVVAGAGSGKTRVLTRRVAYFLQGGVDPHRMLLLTYTNQAAKALVQRLGALCGGQTALADRLWAGTFHQVALRVLRSDGYRLGLTATQVVIERGESIDLLTACLTERTRQIPGLPRAERLLSLLSLSVNTEQTLEQTLCLHAPALLSHAPLLQAVCNDYATRKLSQGLLDYDDLLLYWRLLLCDVPAVRDEQRARFQHIFVDEFQDTSPMQSALCEDLAQGYRSLTVVGDDAQAIYGFRGAAPSNLVEFSTRWPDATVRYLSTNYRSQQSIVAVSNRVLSALQREEPSSPPRPPMRSGRVLPPAVPLPALVSMSDAGEQARFVAQRIQELALQGVPAREIAVLYRAHRHCRELELELLRRGIPFSVRSGDRLSSRTHVQDVLALLRVCQQPTHRLAWVRVLRQVKGLGDTGRARLLDGLFAVPGGVPETPQPRLIARCSSLVQRNILRLFALLSELRELIRQATPQDEASLPQRLIRHLVVRHYRDHALRVFSDAEDRLQDLALLADEDHSQPPSQPGLALGGAEALARFLSQVVLTEDSHRVAHDDRVTLTTVHQAKGLEWRAVFVLSLCEGEFPSSGALFATPDHPDSPTARMQLAEERRLFYVAVTRAKDWLYLCRPQKGGKPGILRPSRFVEDLETAADLVERWRIREGQPADSATAPALSG